MAFVPAAALAEAACVAEPEERELLVQASAGLGMGSYGFSRPSELGEQRLPDAVFPAAAVALAVEGWPDAPFSLTGLLRYQTSLGLRVQEHPPFALPNELSARSGFGELSLAPTFRLESGKTNREAIRLAVPVGLSLRSFWPDVRELLTPGYSLVGPFVRAQVILPIHASFRLRAGPELQAILVLDEHMKKAGLQGQGLALGAEIAAALGPVGPFSLELGYRLSVGRVANRGDGPDFRDTQQLVILTLQGEL
jgi:hypothetical protein